MVHGVDSRNVALLGGVVVEVELLMHAGAVHDQSHTGVGRYVRANVEERDEVFEEILGLPVLSVRNAARPVNQESNVC